MGPSDKMLHEFGVITQSNISLRSRLLPSPRRSVLYVALGKDEPILGADSSDNSDKAKLEMTQLEIYANK